MRGCDVAVLTAHTNWLSQALADMAKIPQPSRGPKRDNLTVLTNYFELIRNQITLNRRRHDQVLLNIYHIQRDRIKRQLGQYSQNNKRLYWLNWFEQQTWSLYTVVHKGNNFTEDNTQVTLNFDFLTNLELESVARETIIEHYDQLNSKQPDWVIETAIDLKSLRLYIDRTRESVKTKQRYSRRQQRMVGANPQWLAKAEVNLRQAVQILKLADNNKLTQPLKVSEFGRVYLGGINLQNSSKTVRHAALGHCYNIDFVVCSTAWKLHTAQQIDAKFTAPQTLKLIRDKNQFRWDLARVIGDNYTNRVKTLLTSIGFGADLTKEPWPNGTDYKLPAVKEIVSTEEIAELKQCPWFMEFLAEQTAMTKIITDHMLTQVDKKDIVDCVKDRGGKIQRSKIMAYLYQHAEAEYMANLLEYVVERFGRDEILLTVHDGVYLRHSINMAEVNSRLQQLNPYLLAERTEHWGHFTAEDLVQETHTDPHKAQADDFLKYWTSKGREGHYSGHYTGVGVNEGYYGG